MKQVRTRFTAALCALTLTLSLVPAALAAQSFADVQPGDWYYNTVMNMVELGAVDGYPDGTFGPSSNISAAEFCKVALEVLPAGENVNLSGTTPEALAAELEQVNPGYWANDVLRQCIQRGVSLFGKTQAQWARPMSREEMVCALLLLYQNSEESPTLAYDERVIWLMGDFFTAGIEERAGAEPILWAYSEGLIGGVNSSGDFNPDGTVTRAEACTILSRFLYPETRLSVDWARAEANQAAFYAAPTRLADGVDFKGKSRIHYDKDVAYDYCRQLEEQIGIQIFYLPEFTEKENGLIWYDSFNSFPLDAQYFQLVLGELQKMKAAYDLYPEGFLKEMISQKSQNRGTEIILCPYTYAGLVSHGIHLYDESGDARKVDQIYYTGIGDTRYYSHEMGHMVMSCAAIKGGWSKVCNDWDSLRNQSIMDCVSAYAMTSRPEDWAETWAALWHDTDQVAAMLATGDYAVLKQKIQYMTNLLDAQYSTFHASQVPWAYLL